ncbi:glycosyltransferase family 2 protein [Telmatospirillum sp.]|uniref:glycosyltransferase family 2 protein n=1 Tax=Telmatospirillum sp. TaxID=2079197 RepID=UPI00284DB39D|nr:glycosyltransferase family 2 protein [Telmatospirillum sp.]MDR3440697.1 glycosyltransferase family 2 protein [Telmatospirillum sp.]
MPLQISIVTPCLNRADMIGDAVESVLHQNDDCFEHIIVDGGSTDGTLDLLRRYPHLRVVSGPDKGIYDALNKGIALTQGRIIGHLNSDDVYEPDAFARVRAAFAAEPDLDSVCGGALICEGATLVRDCSGAGDRILSFANAMLGVPVINARFFTRALYDRVGPYSLDFRLAADRDFLVRAVLAGCRWQSVDAVLYRYRMHGGSATCTKDLAAQVRFNGENAALAEAWLAKPDLPDDLRHCCHRLYGNAVARLAWLRLRQGEPAAAARQLLSHQGSLSLRPLAAAAQSVAVYAMNRRVA